MMYFLLYIITILDRVHNFAACSACLCFLVLAALSIFGLVVGIYDIVPSIIKSNIKNFFYRLFSFWLHLSVCADIGTNGFYCYRSADSRKRLC